MNAKIIHFPPSQDGSEKKRYILTRLSDEAQDNLYQMQGPACPDTEHDFAFAEVNSYGVMVKCTKCGMIDWKD